MQPVLDRRPDLRRRRARADLPHALGQRLRLVELRWRHTPRSGAGRTSRRVGARRNRRSADVARDRRHQPRVGLGLRPFRRLAGRLRKDRRDNGLGNLADHTPGPDERAGGELCGRPSVLARHGLGLVERACEGSGDPDIIREQCRLRDRLSGRLAQAGYCWGRKGQTDENKQWHACQPDSIYEDDIEAVQR
ncbi:hypothetical protein MKK70_05875 [Methylobacterium sp. E-041]|uniref:hypothetical protein n=1 Tax=Methylobacterium sp. E-041 TaxID=2836573 RepID=UPI001FBB2013|nr:hypothetical protein [Methylobacterium sp. E-041]MCJ2104915.1 hypothetical protein [Methylobacterium sp. E-041]